MQGYAGLLIMVKLNSFKVKVTLVVICAMLFAASLSNFLVSKFALDAQFQQLREKLMIVAQTAAFSIDAEALRSIPLDRQAMDTPQYKAIVDRLKQIKAVNVPIRYVYTMKKTGKEGVWQFIVDADALTDEKMRKQLVAYPGKDYDATRFPQMMEAFDRPTADKKLGRDEWGVVLSGYAPIRDKDGDAVAILGVDIKAEDVYNTQREALRRAILALIMGVAFSLILGVFLSRSISGPVKGLVEGTRHIAQGNLRYRVKVKSRDEIGELAASFNEMAQSLYDSRRKLHNYFYRIMQSLVRILEARDHYTRGHSERVAEFAERVALKLGFSDDKVEFIKEVAVLHDIGKLGVQESILNKKEVLTAEEWDIIRKHPLIGEDILKPVLLNEEMLSIIRGHHERYDGKGYPDKTAGDNISLFSQIISVCDAYDAMTSARAYRPALSKEHAVDELKKNKGSQFNPKVVDLFLQAIEES